MSTAATRTFDEHTLRTLPEAPPFLAAARAQAFDEFRAMPAPSPETEEWRYTDLLDFDLSFEPAAVGHPAMTTSNQDLGALGEPIGTGKCSRRVGCEGAHSCSALSRLRLPC